MSFSSSRNTSYSPISVQELSNSTILHNSYGFDGSLLQSNSICIVPLQNPTTKHSVVVGQISSVSEHTDLPDTEGQVISGMMTQDSNSELSKFCTAIVLEIPNKGCQPVKGSGENLGTLPVQGT